MHNDPPMQPPLQRIESGSERRPFELGAVYVVIPGKLSFTILESDEVQP